MGLKKNYVILDQVASGSMGTICKGIQKSLDRLVAIKRIHPHLSTNADFVGRFEREAKASANLKHINILDIIDFGIDEDGTYYIVMEHIDGPTLQQLVSLPTPLPHDVVVSLGSQLLAGLEHAHNNGVVHRDIKPSNLMVTSAGVLKITDFGIAQAAKLPSLTTSGDVFGTPYYMSPEQAQGRSIDHRSDLFSCGIVLYQMVTGVLPFQGDTLAVLNKIVHEEPPPIEVIDPSVPAPIVAVIAKALSKDATRRYYDAAEMLFALENAADQLGFRTDPRTVRAFLATRVEGVSPLTKAPSSSDVRKAHQSSGARGKVRPRLGILPLQGCFGCHVNLLDLHQQLAEVTKAFDVQFSYLADVKQIPKLAIGLVEGCVANVENESMLRQFREQCGTLVALGTCACFGGVPGLRNLHSSGTVIRRSYVEAETNAAGSEVPSPNIIPSLATFVRPVSALVTVDESIPGCPPPPELILDALKHVVDGTKPRIPTHNLCAECRRDRHEMLTGQRKYIADEVHALMELERIDPDLCFLEQGVLCMGMATREGCGARCMKHNTPCHGCMGPPSQVKETGAKWADSLGSLLPGGAVRYRHDLVGSGYRFTLPISLMPQRVDQENK